MRVYFQGERGSFSDIATGEVFPYASPSGCLTFLDVFQRMLENSSLAVVAYENSLAGTVTYVQKLLYRFRPNILGEHFSRIQLCLMGLPDSSLKDLKHVYSHGMALSEMMPFLEEYALDPHVVADTAGAARMVSEWGKRDHCAIASPMAAKLYGLKILHSHAGDNFTRFIILAPPGKRGEDFSFPQQSDSYLRSLFFEVKNVPSALFMVLREFAKENVNLVKLESCPLSGTFQNTIFYTDVENEEETSKSFLRCILNVEKTVREISFLGQSYRASSYRGKLATL